MAAGFQTSVGNQQAVAVEGDFCSHNPRTTVNAGPGGLVAGVNGVIIGRFAWLDYTRVDADNAAAIANSTGAGPPAGFVHREQQGLITDWLAGAGMKILSGKEVTLHQEGDFFVKNNGTGYASPGMKAFARLSDGAVLFAAAGAAGPGASTGTASVAAATFSVTGSVAGNVLTVTAVSSGIVYNGATITGTGLAAGTKVVSQLSGTDGGIGTYALNGGDQTVASTTVSGTYGLMTVTAGGPYTVGSGLSGTGVTAGTTITDIGINADVGKYIVDPTQTVASATLSGTGSIETKWFATSGGQAGELIKMSSWPLG
jgi:hypothetical protein